MTLHRGQVIRFPHTGQRIAAAHPRRLRSTSACSPRADLQTLLLQHPDLGRRMVVTLARQVQSLTLATHDLMHKDAEGRFAAWLLQRCASEAASDGSITVSLNERKRDIASQLAITPETLSRLLRQLSRKGLIFVSGYTVKVLDVAALRALAGD